MPDVPDGRRVALEDVAAELATLRAQSAARTAELQAIAAQLPAVVGRRAMIRALLGDTLANPNKREIVRRGLERAARIPHQACVAIITRFGSRATR